MAAAEAERLRSLPETLARESAVREDQCFQAWLQRDAADVADPAAAAAAAAEAALADACGVVDDGSGYDDQVCVPLLVGNPDSESLDADSVPCVPLDTANQLTSPAAVKAFVEQFQRSPSAQREQLQRGALSPPTAQRMASQARAAEAAAAAAADASSGGAAGQASLDYCACTIDWTTADGRPAGGGSFSTASTSGDDVGGGPLPLSGHFIVCGAEESFAAFVAQLRRCGPAETPIVVLHPTRPEVCDSDGSIGGGGSGTAGSGTGPIYYVEGSASEAASLRLAGASSARALVYLARAGETVLMHGGWRSVPLWPAAVPPRPPLPLTCCLPAPPPARSPPRALRPKHGGR